MSAKSLASLRQRLTKLWLLSPEKLWLISIALQRRGLPLAALAVKQLNTILYHNSLAPGASVSSDISLGHRSHGIVVHRSVEIGRGVKIWHNVTLTAGRPARREGARASGPRAEIVIEDWVKIGSGAVVIAPRGQRLRIGAGARIGAGVVVTHDVPAGATVVSPPARVLLAGQAAERGVQGEQASEPIAFGQPPQARAPVPPSAREDDAGATAEPPDIP